MDAFITSNRPKLRTRPRNSKSSVDQPVHRLDFSDNNIFGQREKRSHHFNVPQVERNSNITKPPQVDNRILRNRKRKLHIDYSFIDMNAMSSGEYEEEDVKMQSSSDSTSNSSESTDENDKTIAHTSINSTQRKSSRQQSTRYHFQDEFEFIASNITSEKSDSEESFEPEPPRQKSLRSRNKAKAKTNNRKNIQKKYEADMSDIESEDATVSVEDEKQADDSENPFIIEKVLACETHTKKEWREKWLHRNTRFLVNGSIFLDDDNQTSDNDVTVISSDDDEDNKSFEDDSSTLSNGKAIDGLSVSDLAAKRGKSNRGIQNDDAVEEERFLIKWKHLSYLHASWETEKSLLSLEKNAKGKLHRFREKLIYQVASLAQSDEYFNPEYRVVDRILDIKDQPDDEFQSEIEEENTIERLYFLVKWKALSYDQLTWEREDDVDDDDAVNMYHARIRSAMQRMRGHRTNTTKRRIAFREYTKDNGPAFKKGLNYELRDYQLTGLNWLLFNWYHSRSSLLADEMGLGKTVQTVAYINHLSIVEKLAGPFVIIAPLSTLGHWQREFTNWTDLNAIVYHGSSLARDVIRQYEFHLPNEVTRKVSSLKSDKQSKFYQFDVLITTYEMCCTNDCGPLTSINWQVMVVDEAHRLKNRSSKLSEAIRKRFSYANMLLLTGTPLQNNVEELWTLLNFLDPEKFDTLSEFIDRYGDLKNAKQVEALQKELKPFLLRRMKEDVEKSLAPKEETIIEVELTVIQKQYYRAIYEKNTEFLTRGTYKASEAPSLMNIMMELRKCCNHPFLIKGMEEREMSRIKMLPSISEAERNKQMTELLVSCSGKLVLMDKLLPRLNENGHRVLIFSQFKIMLDILTDYLQLRKYRYERIDGNVTGNERQAAIDRYCRKDSNSFIMLLSTRAGGVGINLTAADTVIIYDSDWNPQNDLQAQARCHRIGQDKSVKIYRLLTSKTYELHMFHQASMKLGLDHAILGGMKKHSNTALKKNEIESLLKHGAYEIFKEEREGEEAEASRRFGEESIDQILNRSTKIIHDPKSTNADIKGIMSSFSKATFVSSTNPEQQVAIDDPDFWSKVIGFQDTADAKHEPSPLKKRRCRRAITSYAMIEENFGHMKENETQNAKAMFTRITDKFANEEYIVEDEESSEDEDEYRDEFEANNELGGYRKSKTIRTTETLGKSLTEGLARFGYGRWDDIMRAYPNLQEYPIVTIQTYSREFIVHCIRTASKRFISKCELLPELILQPTETTTSKNLNSDARQMSTSALGKKSSDYYLDRFSSRYSFIEYLLEASGSLPSFQSVSAIPLSNAQCAQMAAVYGEREAHSKLTHLSRMHDINEFYKKVLTPAKPLIIVCKKLIKLEDTTIVNEYIRSGQLPTVYDEKKLDEGISSPSTRDENMSNANLASKDNINKVGKGTMENDVSMEKESDLLSDPIIENNKSLNFVTKDTRPTDLTAALIIGKPIGDTQLNTLAPQSVPKNSDGDQEIKNDMLAPKAAAAIYQENLSTPEKKNEDKEITLKSGDASLPMSPKIPTRAEIEQIEILKRINTLPPALTSGPSTVAPWWIPFVDDLLLLLSYYKDGWPIHRRTLSARFFKSECLFFGERAKLYKKSEWPSMSTLNSRVKQLLISWSEKRRTTYLAGLAKKEREVQRDEARKKWMENCQADLLRQVKPPTYMPLHNTKANTYHPIHKQWDVRNQHHHLPPSLNVKDTAPIDAKNNTKTALDIAQKRNRFAKIVFSFGIPDIRSCHSDEEREEKWRYFLTDKLLNIEHMQYNFTQLEYEALDLEHSCRIRLNLNTTPVNNPNLQNHSVLGGSRGNWLMLTLAQCNRLIHRIDLFRMLRSRILVIHPTQLTKVITIAVKNLSKDIKNDLPIWWKSPSLDQLLIQGVECYGLDQHLENVWQLTPFLEANGMGKPYPTSVWVENYVRALVHQCLNLIALNRTSSSQEMPKNYSSHTPPIPPAPETPNNSHPPTPQIQSKRNDSKPVTFSQHQISSESTRIARGKMSVQNKATPVNGTTHENKKKGFFSQALASTAQSKDQASEIIVIDSSDSEDD